jgi:hypothetical protein
MQEEQKKMTFRQYFNWLGGLSLATTVLMLFLKATIAVDSWIANTESDHTPQILLVLGLLISTYNHGTVLWTFKGVVLFLEYLPANIEQLLVAAEIQGWISPSDNASADLQPRETAQESMLPTARVLEHHDVPLRASELVLDEQPLNRLNQADLRCLSEDHADTSPRTVGIKFTEPDLRESPLGSRGVNTFVVDSGSSTPISPLETTSTSTSPQDVNYPTLPTSPLARSHRRSPVLAIAPSLYVLARYITDLHSQCLGLWAIVLHPNGCGTNVDFLWSPRKMMLQMDAIINRLERVSHTVGGSGAAVFSKYPAIEAEVMEVLGLFEVLQQKVQSQDLNALIAPAKQIVAGLATVRKISTESYWDHANYKNDHISGLISQVERYRGEEERKVSEEVRQVSEKIRKVGGEVEEVGKEVKEVEEVKEVKEVNETASPMATEMDVTTSNESLFDPANELDVDTMKEGIQDETDPEPMDEDLPIDPANGANYRTTNESTSNETDPDAMDEEVDINPANEPNSSAANHSTTTETYLDAMDEEADHATAPEGLTGPKPLIEALVAQVHGGRFPTTTSSRAYLSGPRALFKALKSMNAISQSNMTVWDVLKVMFADFNRQAAETPAVKCQKGRQGNPSAEYLAFLDGEIRPQFTQGSIFDGNGYRAKIQSLTKANDFSEQQLWMMLAFMVQQGMCQPGILIGIADAGDEFDESTSVKLMGQHRPDVKIVWLYKTEIAVKGAEPAAHWEGFVRIEEHKVEATREKEKKHGFEIARSWGLPGF